MDGYKKRTGYMASSMMALLLCALFFSCTDEDFFVNNSNGLEYACDNICFGITSDKNVQTRGSVSGSEREYTTQQLVLRSQDSADTLCVRAIVSDGIDSSVSTESQVVTRGTPITTENFSSFHLLAYWKKDGTLVEKFYMDEDITPTGGNVWSSDRIYYWPGKNHSLQFYAWSPIEADGLNTPDIPTNKTLSYVVPEDATMQKDIIVATTEEIPGDNNKLVSLDFNHICTAVRFVTGAEMQPGIIKSVSLEGVRYAGSYDMATGQWSLADEQKSFMQELNKEMSGTETEGAEITTIESTFMMLPQILPEGAKIKVVFHSTATNTDRTLEALFAGMEWPMGKTVTYKLSITPEYELDFISEPALQDAHYVIYPIKIKAKDVPAGSWTMTSSSPEVTLRTDLTVLNQRGFWIEEDKGEQSITSTAMGEDITVYAFLTENVTEETREVELTLRPTTLPDAKPATFKISQHCPSWNGDIGCERFEDGDYPWGFLWPKGMKIKYNMENAGLGDLIRNALLNAYLAWFTDYGQFITKETWILSITSVTINYDAIPQVAVAKDENNGLKNTLELYNFNGISDVSTLEDILENWGGVPEQTLPLNPEEFAARACSMKNKYHKTTEQQGGQTLEIPILPSDEITWYLPAKNEAIQMADEIYPLSGDYWTSTNSLDEYDNENAFKYMAGGSSILERRDVNLHVRAVRKKP